MYVYSYKERVCVSAFHSRLEMQSSEAQMERKVTRARNAKLFVVFRCSIDICVQSDFHIVVNVW